MKLFRTEVIDNHRIFKICGIKLKIIDYATLIKSSEEEVKKHCSNEIFTANWIKEVHSKTFPQFKNCNIGKDVVILATGPTMKFYKPIKNAIHIGVNKAFKREDIHLDYAFTIDYSGDKFIDEILNLKDTVKFLGTQRHKSTSICTIPMHYYLNKKDTYMYVSDYPVNLMYPDLSCFGLMDFGSITHEAIHFAFYTHPKRIYLVGCDCSNCGYFDGTQQRFSAEYMIEGWEKIKQFKDQYYPDIEVISINPVGLKGLFTDVYT